jgi:hypothetical protein
MTRGTFWLVVLVILVGLSLNSYHQGTLHRWHRSVGEGGWIGDLRSLAEEMQRSGLGDHGRVQIRVADYWRDQNWRELWRTKRQLATEGISELGITNSNGGVTVVGREGAGPVELEAACFSSRRGTTGPGANSMLEVTREQGTWQVRVRLPKDRPDLRCLLYVTCPQALAARVTSASGDLQLRQVARVVALSASGDVTVAQASKARARSASGDVHATRISEQLDATAVSGDVTMAEVEGQVHASTASGDIQAQGVTGPLTASSVSGDVYVADYRGEKVQLKTTSGGIELYIAEPFSGDCHAESVSGDVDVHLLPDSSCRVEMFSLSGDTGFGDLPLTQVTTRQNRLSGVLGAGQGTVELRSLGGSATIGDNEGEPLRADRVSPPPATIRVPRPWSARPTRPPAPSRAPESSWGPVVR